MSARASRRIDEQVANGPVVRFELRVIGIPADTIVEVSRFWPDAVDIT